MRGDTLIVKPWRPGFIMPCNGSIAANSIVAKEPPQALSPARVPPTTQFDPRTRLLIEGPITPTLLRLAAPNVLVMVVQASVGLIETYFVGKLGTDALAGVALVFPALMLMQMMSAGAMGGGISSAIARALGAARPRHRRRLRACLYGSGARWRAMALWRDGRNRIIARCGSDLFQRNLCKRGPAVALQLARKRHSRDRQHGGAGGRDLYRRGGADPVVSVSDLRLGTVSPAWDRGRCRSGDRVLRGGKPGACVVSVLVAQPDPPFASRIRISLDAVSRDSARGRRRGTDNGRHQCHDRGRDRIDRPVRTGGDRRLRYRLAHRIPPDPAGLRPRRPARRHRGDQYRGGRARPGFACRLDRRRNRGRAVRDHRPPCGSFPARLVVAVRRERGHARRRIAVSAGRGSLLWPVWSRHGALFRLARRRPARLAAHCKSHPARHCSRRLR